jgi:hypothetical protein
MYIALSNSGQDLTIARKPQQGAAVGRRKGWLGGQVTLNSFTLGASADTVS